ncbi:MAG: hypothetical protein AB7H48_03395 [Parachlamydiales bacterium]
MDLDKLIEKLKRNWKRILIIGVSAYVGFTILSMAIGVVFFTKIKRQVEHEKEDIGQEFQNRKEDFHERFNKNWNEKLNKLAKSFAESEKRANQSGLDGLKNVQKSIKEDLNGKSTKTSETKKIRLQKDLFQLSKEIVIAETAFKKKWFSQIENETNEQYERRRDEGAIDWRKQNIKRCERQMEDINDEMQLEEDKLNLEKHRKDLQYLQNSFQEKYGEPYEDIEFQKLCAVLKEQAQKEVQDFLDDIAAKESEKERNEELVYLTKTRNEVVREEKDAQRERENTYPRLWHLQKVLVKYGKYNDLKAKFEKKWGMAADEPLEKLKADWKDGLSFNSVNWENGSGDYLQKATDLKELLPEMERALNLNSIVEMRQRLSKKEGNFKKWKERGRKDSWMDETEARLEKLQFRPSIAALEAAYKKKWSPRKANETEEEYQRRVDEGEIQFFTTLVEREKIDRTTERLGQNYNLPIYNSQLEKLKEEFLEKYGEECPKLEIGVNKE